MRSPFFPHRFLAFLLAVSISITPFQGYAAPRATVDLPEPYKIPTRNPSTIEAIQDVTGRPSEAAGEIFQDLSLRAVCGGWNMNLSAVGKIPTVGGVPGRASTPLIDPTTGQPVIDPITKRPIADPFTKKASGMAERDESTGALDDGYVFPTTARARGWSTACGPGFPPFYDDAPPCKDPDEDPNKDNMATPDRCENICQRMNSWQSPIWIADWKKAPTPATPGETRLCVQHGNGPKERNNSPTNGDCCERLGQFDENDTDPRDKAPSCINTYPPPVDPEDPSAPVEPPDPNWNPYPGSMPPDAECWKSPGDGFVLSSIIFSGWYYCCTGAKVRQLGYESCKLDTPGACAAHPDPRRNCVRCAGDGVPIGIMPGAEAACLSNAECPSPLVCYGLVPEEVFDTPCINARDCEIAVPCLTFNPNPEYAVCMANVGDNAYCTALYPPIPNCKPWICNADEKCAHPAIPGSCLLSTGEVPTIDDNNEIVQRVIRRETGCRGGYGVQLDGSLLRPGLFVSYFREYPKAGYERGAVPKVAGNPPVNIPDVTTRINIPVTCYGRYDEFDAKKRVTSYRDQRCVIAAYNAGNDFQTFYKTQIGRGRFGQEQIPVDPDPTAPTEIRNRTFDVNEDLWYQNLGGAFSLLNGEVFKKNYGQDMTFALLTLDDTKERARGPKLQNRIVDPPADPYASFRSVGGVRRAFDDSVMNETGTRRFVTEAWQRYETDMQQFLHPPVVHIIFPSAWSANLGLQDTLFYRDPPDPPLPPAMQWSHEPERKTMEAQLEVRDDVIGEVATFLENALIAPVREYPLPLVVPFGSATDFRAYKEGWIRWKKLRQHAGATPSAGVDALINRLEEYAVQIDKSRALRAELPNTLGQALLQQSTIRSTINNWLIGHLAAFQAFEEQRKTVRDQLSEWKDVQKAYRDFHDITNMPWCKNDAFTISIYSLLDPWTGSRPGEGPLPMPTVKRPEDLFIDLTAFEVSTDTISIPVLKPVQILVSHDELQPPSAMDTEPDVPELPPLPPLPILSISEDLEFPVKTEEGMTLAYPTLGTHDGQDYASVAEFIHSLRETVREMTAAYAKFWNAVTKPRCGTKEAEVRCRGDDPAKGNCCVIAGEEKYCRKGWGQDTCVHVEMDLIERFTRMGARPAVQLKEDFSAKGDWRSAGVGFLPCDPQDWACQNLHQQRTLQKIGWFSETKVADQASSLDAWRVQMFEDTLQNVGASSSAFPYQADRNTITPSFDERPSININPEDTSPSP